MIRTSLINPLNKTALSIEPVWDSSHKIHGDEQALMVVSPEQAHGTFKGVSRATAGTDVIAMPNDGGALRLSGWVLGTEKQNSATVTVQWNDGIRTDLIFKGFANDATIMISKTYKGKVEGWSGAWVEWVVVGNLDSSISIEYVKVPSAPEYDEWDKAR